MRALLIDDDYKACANLKFLLAEHCPEVEVIGEANFLKDAVEIIESLHPALIFLDVQMSGEVGFDLLGLTDLSNTQIIIVSAYEEFALSAFKIAAIDYLLKPVNPADLVEAVSRARQQKMAGKSDVEELISLIANKQKPAINKIGIPTVFGSTFIDENNIIRCEADRNYTRIVLKGNQKIFMSSKNLSQIESLLATSQFVRVHHSHLVNLNYVHEFHKGKQAFLILENGDNIPISQNKQASVINALNMK